MEPESLPAGIQHAIAELRAAQPRISACHASLEAWQEAAEPRFALQLDIRSPLELAARHRS